MLTARRVIAQAVALSIASGPAAQEALGAPCEPQASMATEFGRFVPWQRIVKSNESRPLDSGEELRYLRLQVRNIAAADVAWSLTIRDRFHRPMQTFSSRHMLPGIPVWTDRLAASAVTLHTTGPSPTVPVVETLKYIAVPKDALRPYYSKQEAVPAWHDLYCCNTPAYKREIDESVGMFIAQEGNAIDGVALWTCSGFVIANDPQVLFVTNHHCGDAVGDPGERWSNDVLCVNDVTVDFSWDGDTIGRQYKCEKVEARSPEDDLVVLRLVAIRPEAPPPVLPIRSTRASEIPVWTVHHPAAESKKISREECLAHTTSVFGVPTVNAHRDFAHRCDTEAGSSGAPMLDAEGAVVGIHHVGFETTGPLSCDKLNKAVHADRLLRLLAEKPELKGYRIVP